MYSTFHLTAEELNSDFISGVKKLFKGRKITVIVKDEATLSQEQQEWVTGLQSAYQEAILFENGKLNLKPAREILNEL